MNHYYKIRTPYDGRQKDLYGDKPRYFWVKKDAQARCDELNATDDAALNGTFTVLERRETLGKFDDTDAKDVLGNAPPVPPGG